MAGLDPTIALGPPPPSVLDAAQKYGNLSLLRNQIQLSNETLDPSIRAAKANAATAEVGTKEAQQRFDLGKLGLLQAHVANSLTALTPLANKPDLSYEDIAGTLQTMLKNSGAPPEALNQALNQVQQGKSPAEYQNLLRMKIAEATGAQNVLNMITGTPSSVAQGGQIQPGMTGGALSQRPGAFTPAGAAVPMTLPPTATTVATPGAAPTYVGGTAQGAEPGTVLAGNPMGQQEATIAGIAPMAKHYEGIQSAAAAAPQRITQLQEIKTLAPEAMTGDANTLRTILSKLAGYFGADIKEMSQTKTDELAKATALLMDRAGATDAAREVAAMATPNYKMTKEAINNVSNALIGMEKRNLAASSYFSGVPVNSDEYNKRFATWNNIPARDKVFMMDAMPLDERQALMNKIRGTPAAADVLKGAKLLRDLRLLQ